MDAAIGLKGGRSWPTVIMQIEELNKSDPCLDLRQPHPWRSASFKGRGWRGVSGGGVGGSQTASLPFGSSRRASRAAERALDDPLREMDSVFVDEYGR